jgi:hypothetical protein
MQSVIAGLADSVMFPDHLNVRVEILWLIFVLSEVLIGFE